MDPTARPLQSRSLWLRRRSGAAEIDEESTNSRRSDDRSRRLVWHFGEVMANEAEDIRCEGCGRLLARVQGGVLAIQRGDLQATFDGEFRVSFVCPHPKCRRLNSVRVRSQLPGRPASS